MTKTYAVEIRDRNGRLVRCVRHSRYQAKRKPVKSRDFPHGCPDCSAMYATAHACCPSCGHVVTISGRCLNVRACVIARKQRAAFYKQPEGRHRYDTKEVTLRKRKRVVWVEPAIGTDREQLCGRVTRIETKDGRHVRTEQCSRIVEWCEFTPSGGGSHSYACDDHVTPPLEDQS